MFKPEITLMDVQENHWAIWRRKGRWNHRPEKEQWVWVVKVTPEYGTAEVQVLDLADEPTPDNTAVVRLEQLHGFKSNR